MSEFEFVQVTIAIILGLGLTEILRSVGEQIRRRSEIQVSLLHIAASSLLLLVILRWLWAFWATLEVSWNLPLFLLIVSPAIALALCAQVIRVDLNSTESPQHQYFQNCRATYLIWATAPTFGMFFDTIVHGYTWFDAFRFIPIGFLVSLAFVKNPTYHWVALLCLLGVLFGGMAYSLFELS